MRISSCSSRYSSSHSVRVRVQASSWSVPRVMQVPPVVVGVALVAAVTEACTFLATAAGIISPGVEHPDPVARNVTDRGVSRSDLVGAYCHSVDPFLFVADDCCDVDGEHECDDDEGGEVVVFHLFASIRWSAVVMRWMSCVARCSVCASLLAHRMARFQSPMAARNLPWSRMTQEWFSRRMVRFTGAPWRVRLGARIEMRPRCLCW